MFEFYHGNSGLTTGAATLRRRGNFPGDGSSI